MSENSKKKTRWYDVVDIFGNFIDIFFTFDHPIAWLIGGGLLLIVIFFQEIVIFLNFLITFITKI